MPTFIEILRDIRDGKYPEIVTKHADIVAINDLIAAAELVIVAARDEVLPAAGQAVLDAAQVADDKNIVVALEESVSTKHTEIIGLSAAAVTLVQGTAASASYNPTTGVMTIGVPQGVKGDRGEAFNVSAQGLAADRVNYDLQPQGFSYFAEDEGLIYFKASATSGDWGTGISFGKGDDGEAVNLQVVDNVIQWQYASDGAVWTNLVDLETVFNSYLALKTDLTETNKRLTSLVASRLLVGAIAINGANLELTDGQLIFSNGYIGNHALNTGEEFIGANAVNPTWVNGALNYVKRVKDTSWVATIDKPVFGNASTRDVAGYNPDIYVDGKWYDSINGDEKVVNGDFTTDTTGWTAVDATLASTLDELVVTYTAATQYVYQNITTIAGKEYTVRVRTKSTNAVDISLWAADTVFNGTIISRKDIILSTSYVDMSITFIAQSTTTSLVLYSLLVSGTYEADDFTCFETNIEPNTAYTTPITYIDGGVEVDGAGNLVEYRANELIVPDVVVSEIVTDGIDVRDRFNLNQNLVNETANRIQDVEYLNDSGKPMQLAIYIGATTTSPPASLKINGDSIIRHGTTTGIVSTLTWTVKAGDTYELTGATAVYSWYEEK